MIRSTSARKRAAFLACLLLTLAITGRAAAAPSNTACEQRINDTPAKLLECIQEPALFGHLADLQAISDAHPGPDGHGNRDTGRPGYKASVDYVAALVRQAGYEVTVQSYDYEDFEVDGTPTLSVDGRAHVVGGDWFVARLSGDGSVTGRVAPVGGLVTEPAGQGAAGCSRRDFAGFASGDIALIQRGGCALDAKVANAEAAGAAGVVLFNYPGAAEAQATRGAPPQGGAWPARLERDARIPVAAMAAYAVGADLFRQAQAGRAPSVHLDIRTRTRSAIDYNLIADSPFGDPHRVVVLEGHLDAIYGAGILDNGSGSSTMLEIALKLARTPTKNQLRYIWFGGEELGLLGSKYYTQHLAAPEVKRIAFDIDADVTATPNYVVLVANPRFAGNVETFPSNVVPQSERGNALFFDYFHRRNIPVRNASFGNDGTDSNAFARVGVPNTGILTQQDCCKTTRDVAIWGGFPGNYEGDIPSFDGGCVDNPHLWCDNLTNIAPYVLEFVSKSVAYVTLKLADDPSLPVRGG